MKLIDKVKAMAAQAQKDCPKLRDGQAMFSALYEVNPELANEIRGTDIDPYFSQPDDRRMQSFLDAIEGAKQ